MGVGSSDFLPALWFMQIKMGENNKKMHITTVC